MDYGIINDSAVPHISTLSSEFSIEYLSYRNTLVMECSFIILVLPFLGIWIYFSTKSRKSKKNRQEAKDGHQNSGNFQQNMSNAQSMADPQQQTPNLETDSYKLDATKTRDNDKAWKRLQIIDRRLCYVVSFFAIHATAVNSFDSNVLSMVSFYLTFTVYLLFNVVRPKKNAFLIGMYMIPVFTSAFSFWLGDHKLGQHQAQ